MPKTEVVRVGTLKLLSERVTEMREEIDKLESIIRTQRCQLTREGRDAPKARKLRKANGQTCMEAKARGHRESETKGATTRMAPETWG